MVFLQLGKDTPSTCPEKLGSWPSESIRETESHWSTPQWLNSHRCAFVGAAEARAEAMERRLSRDMLTSWGKWLPENQPWGSSEASCAHHKGCVHPPLLTTLCLKFGGAWLLRTKANKCLRLSLQKESTSTPIGKLPGLITNKQGTHSHCL